MEESKLTGGEWNVLSSLSTFHPPPVSFVSPIGLPSLVYVVDLS